MSVSFPWGVLGIARTGDIAAIRRAYAVKLKAMDVDIDPDLYAQLRRARDSALWQATATVSTPAPADDEMADDQAEASAARALGSWPYAAPEVLIEHGTDLPAVTVGAPTPDRDGYRHLAGGFSSGAPPTAGALAMGQVFGTPALSEKSADDGLRPVQRPDVRLSALLQAGETPLSDGDENEARACLRALLRDTAAEDLARHNALDVWLADLMARSWPRCAPLLEEAAIAMGWTHSTGRLGETKAVAFLNARLAGYLLQRDVQQPSHPFHRAWVELSRPGRAGVIRLLPLRFSPLKQQIRDALKLIQRQFPEIESFLDPQRVASWETAMPTGRHYVFRLGRHYSLRIRWVWIATFVAIRLLIAFSQSTEIHQPTYVSSPAPAKLDPQVVTALNEAILTAFGPGKTIDWLRVREPDLSDWLSQQAWNQNYMPSDAKALAGHVEREVRRRAYIAARLEAGPDLDAAMRVRAGLIDAARRAGGSACTEFLASGFLPDNLDQPAELRRDEQNLAAHLVELGKLHDYDPPPPAHTNVPGTLVQKVIEITGLSHDRVVKALTGKSIDQDRCAVEDALIKTTLAWHGKNRTAILRVL